MEKVKKTKIKLVKVTTPKTTHLMGGMRWAYDHCTGGQGVVCCNWGDGTGTHCSNAD